MYMCLIVCICDCCIYDMGCIDLMRTFFYLQCARKLEMISVVTQFEGCTSQMGTLWNVTALTCHPFRIIRMKANHVSWVCLQI